jgi:hypothetical protein
MRRSLLAPTAWLLAASVAVAFPQASLGVGPLQPTTYGSPSGTCTLAVDPTTRLGAGAADCRVVNADGVAWERRLPFTLRGACIDDDGYAAGYGYDQGWNGVTPNGQFLIAVLSPSGDVLARHDWPMQSGRGIHSAPVPRVRELVHDAQRRNVLVRVEDEDREGAFESWRVVDLQSGALVESIRPEQRADWNGGRPGSIVDVALLPGTGCYAVCWRFAVDGVSSACADMRLSVVDSAGRTQAELDFPGELGNVGYSLWRTIWTRGTLRIATSEGRFDLWLPSSRALAHLRFVREAPHSTGKLELLGRAPFTPDAGTGAPPGPQPVAARLELALVAETELDAFQSSEPGPIRDIAAIGIEGPGRLQIIRLEDRNIVRMDDRETGRFTSLVLDEDGHVLTERGFGPFEADQPWQWWSLGAGRWLTWPGPVLFDTRLGTAEALTSSGFRDVDGAVGMPGGGFVVLGDRAALFAGVGPALAAYDASGKQLWVVRPRSHAADDVAADSVGRIAVACPWSDVLELFGSDGSALASLDLAELWGRNPSYVARLECDLDGGFLVQESPSAPEVLQLAGDGSIRATIVPRAPDGSTDTKLARNLKVAADGRLWTTDGRALFRLGADGKADRVLGSERVVEVLGAPAQAVIDPLGRLAIRDGATRAVHVFDPHGSRLFAAAGLPGDFEGHSNEGDIAVDREGRLHLSTLVFEGGWLAFDAQGARLGPVDLGGWNQYVPYGVAFAPGTPSYWRIRTTWERQSAVRFELDGREITSIDRRPDRRWFESLQRLAVSPAGHVAVVEETPHSGAGAQLLLYEASGHPRAQIALPSDFDPHRVAHGGRWIALTSFAHADVLLVSDAEHSLHWLRPPTGWDAQRDGVIGFSPNGSELWLLHAAGLKLWRFALP